MKKIAILLIMLMSMAVMSACVKDQTNTGTTYTSIGDKPESEDSSNINSTYTSGDDNAETNHDSKTSNTLTSTVDQSEAENSSNTSNTMTSDEHKAPKLHDDISAENITHVNLRGNARSIVLQQSENEYFEIHNADLNPDHTYEVHCTANDGTLDINIMMESAEDDNNILGSVVIDIPQKEFEKIETAGQFSLIYLHTLKSDVFIHANGSSVILDLEADHLDHNITLDGSDANAFRSVSVYLDKIPDNISIEPSLTHDGTIYDEANLLKNNRLKAGSGKPVISINKTEKIDIYLKG